jgi:hypothetical protein
MAANNWLKTQLKRLPGRIYRFPWFTLLLILALTFLAYWVGVRAKDPPTNLHSLGIVATVPGGNRIKGENLPAISKCRHCGTSADLISYAGRAGLRVDMVIAVHPTNGILGPDCGKADVDMVVSATRRFWAQHDRIGPNPRDDPLTRSLKTVFAIGWDRATQIRPPSGVTAIGAPALVAFYNDEQAALHPGFYTNADLLRKGDDAYQNKVASYPQRDPVGLRTQTYNWDYYYVAVKHHRLERLYHRWALQLHFQANWVQPRGWGSCYVLIPSLLANGAFAGTQNAIKALDPTASLDERTQLLSEAKPPSYGRVALAVDGSFSLPDTNPAPTDFEAIFVGANGSPKQRASQLALHSGGRLGPVWSCRPSDNLTYLTAPKAAGIPSAGSFPGDACGTVAVVNAVGASDIRAVFLIVIGVLIALAFERFFRRLGSSDPEWPLALGARAARWIKAHAT